MAHDIRLEWEFPREDHDIRNCSAWVWRGEEKQCLYYVKTSFYSAFNLSSQWPTGSHHLPILPFPDRATSVPNRNTRDWIYSIFSLNTYCFKVNLSANPPFPQQFCRLEWKPNKRHGIVWFENKPGVEFNDMLRKSRAESKSRKFVASDGAEYKWKQAGPDDRDLECFPPPTLFIQRGSIATWAANSKSLTVTPGGQAIMDDLVCMLLIHLWRLKWGHTF
ncbi:hypothetical protein BS47DRAFT_1362858 [Hydnum rufescens UP504]|uniref:DUF6593 domain-containing protein n=1 Tax=Hydnum rufescens UP504 TaxID=1448309 RepID=A0A9P6AVP0_9AGAM|nr:hypothetical protein BS47DRAFT_1362858 [Hydnum rufescens UP504]